MIDLLSLLSDSSFSHLRDSRAHLPCPDDAEDAREEDLGGRGGHAGWGKARRKREREVFFFLYSMRASSPVGGKKE